MAGRVGFGDEEGGEVFCGVDEDLDGEDEEVLRLASVVRWRCYGDGEKLFRCQSIVELGGLSLAPRSR